MVKKGDLVQVGPAKGVVQYTEKIGCCGGLNIAVRLDGTGNIVYCRPEEVREILADQL